VNCLKFTKYIKRKNEIESIFNKISSVKSDTNDKMIFIRKKLCPKFNKDIIIILFAKLLIVRFSGTPIRTSWGYRMIE